MCYPRHLALVRTLLRSGHFTSQDTLLLGKGVLISLVPRLSPSHVIDDLCTTVQNAQVEQEEGEPVDRAMSAVEM